MDDGSSKRVLVIGRDPATAAALSEVLTPETCCDSVINPAEAPDVLARGHYALVVIDVVEREAMEAIVAAASRIPRRDRPLLFVLFDSASSLPAQLDPRVVTLMIQRPVSERVLRDVLGQAIRRMLAVGGEITLRRLREAGALRSNKSKRRARSVLVVDDDRPIRELLAAVLRREGLTADTASDGERAIQALDERNYTVLVLDLMMPRLSGWEVIGWLRANPANRPRSVIVCTAADRAVFSELDPEVVNAIFVKPFDVAELGAYVRATTEVPEDRRRARVIGSPPSRIRDQ
ncbi:MAG: response regulator [Thermoanaerobaculia bacterium]